MSRYSDTVMDHFLEPRNRGSLAMPAGVGVSGRPGEGPFLVFQVACRNRVVTEAAFECHNCGVTVASGSILTELVIGESLQQCLQMDAETVAAALDGVPPDKLHVPEFAIRAMHQAVRESD